VKIVMENVIKNNVNVKLNKNKRKNHKNNKYHKNNKWQINLKMKEMNYLRMENMKKQYKSIKKLLINIIA